MVEKVVITKLNDFNEPQSAEKPFMIQKSYVIGYFIAPDEAMSFWKWQLNNQYLLHLEKNSVSLLAYW